MIRKLVFALVAVCLGAAIIVSSEPRHHGWGSPHGVGSGGWPSGSWGASRPGSNWGGWGGSQPGSGWGGSNGWGQPGNSWTGGSSSWPHGSGQWGRLPPNHPMFPQWYRRN